MPFKSRKQSKACFATHGFGNKVDCKEWAHATNYKNLKMKGGKSKMGKCKYGCMQAGGQFLLDGSWQPGYYKNGVWEDTGPVVPKAQTPSGTPLMSNPFGDSPWIAKGQHNPLVATSANPLPIGQSPNYRPQQWHNTPADIDPNTGATFNERLPDDHPDNPGTGQSVGTYADRSGSVTETTTKAPHNWNNDIFFGLRGAQMAADFLANKKRDNRMNDYDYKQQTALGQMNAMPISQFQYNDNNYTTPNRMYAEQGGVMNPYSYHSKYGGNLKRILKDYKKWTNDVNPMDMGEGHIDNQGLMKKGGFALDEMVVSDFIRKLMQFGHGPHPYSGMHRSRRGGRPVHSQQQQGNQQQMMQIIQAYAQMQGVDPQEIISQLQKMQPEQRQQAIQQMTQALQQGQQQQQMQPGMQVGGRMLKKGGNWIQGAVNPAHKGYCTPMTKATCTPRRKAFAMTMKKHHGFHK